MGNGVGGEQNNKFINKKLIPIQLEKLVCGYLRNQHNEYKLNGLIALKDIIHTFSQCMTTKDKYYQILFSTKPHYHLGASSKYELEIFSSIPPDSNYYININICPKCYKSSKSNSNDYETILKFNASYKTKISPDNVIFSVSEDNKEDIKNVKIFENNAMEYKCKECGIYIAYNMGNRIVRQRKYEDAFIKQELSIFGDRTSDISGAIKGKIGKRLSGNNNNKETKCPECNEVMVRIGRSKDNLNMRTGYRDLCKNCDLVSTTTHTHNQRIRTSLFE